MTETLIVNDELSLEEKYKLLDKQIRSLLNPEENIISNLANFAAAIKQTFDKVSWVGFYMFDGKKLYLGPFQGKVACTVIEPGKGVCGAAADMKQTIIVEDVNKFEGHIQCDPDSKSEIVIPLIKDNELFGVLDLDSTTIGAFNKTDKKYLEDYCSFLISEII